MFHREKLRRAMDTFNTTADQFVNKLQGYTESGETFMLAPILHRSTIDIVMRVCLLYCYCLRSAYSRGVSKWQSDPLVLGFLSSFWQIQLKWQWTSWPSSKIMPDSHPMKTICLPKSINLKKLNFGLVPFGKAGHDWWVAKYAPGLLNKTNFMCWKRPGSLMKFSHRILNLVFKMRFHLSSYWCVWAKCNHLQNCRWPDTDLSPNF